ncbi:MAG: GMC family oxidoreductase [Acidobacteria bacterium]|nr:GMC family oxidoreductase [Acidobacteriota bacterium]
MAETYDVIICGAGSGGGFLAGEIAPNARLLILDAGPYYPAKPKPGHGSPGRREASTQMNLGTYAPDGVNSRNSGALFFAHPIYMDASNPGSAAVQREAKIVGGGSQINVGAWIRPNREDWDQFAEETQVEGWTREAFERYFLRAEEVLHVHRNKREHWNRASQLYDQAARELGIRTIPTASNRYNCIFCGQRLNAGMPCKYDALMSTAMTQIPKAVDEHGAVLHDNATVLKIVMEGRRAAGVVYRRNGETITALASKLVVISAGAIGSPAIFWDSDLHLVNPNAGKWLRAHPGIGVDAIMPGEEDWGNERGYQWNLHHFAQDDKGNHIDAIIHASSNFNSATSWAAAQIGFFGKPYKDLMRRNRQRVGAFIFQLKPNMSGEVAGGVAKPVISYPVAGTSGLLEPKTMNDFIWGLRAVGSVYKRLGAAAIFPNPEQPLSLLKTTLTQLVVNANALHPQSTLRAARDRRLGVVDQNCMAFDAGNLMVCDASVIPNHLSSNPNSMIMAIGARCGEFVNTHILDRRRQ